MIHDLFSFNTHVQQARGSAMLLPRADDSPEDDWNGKILAERRENGNGDLVGARSLPQFVFEPANQRCK